MHFFQVVGISTGVSYLSKQMAVITLTNSLLLGTYGEVASVRSLKIQKAFEIY